MVWAGLDSTLLKNTWCYLIRSRHNNLLNYFVHDKRDLSRAYVKHCEKFLDSICWPSYYGGSNTGGKIFKVKKPQASMDQQASKKGLDRAWALGYYGSMSSRFKPVELFRTFKSEKEFHEYVQGHSLPEERRLLWLGFAFGCNFAVNKINKDLASKKK